MTCRQLLVRLPASTGAPAAVAASAAGASSASGRPLPAVLRVARLPAVFVRPGSRGAAIFPPLLAAAAWRRRARAPAQRGGRCRATVGTSAAVAPAPEPAPAAAATVTLGRVDLHFFSDASFKPLRDQFVGSLTDAGLTLRETYVEDLGVIHARAAGGVPVYLFKTKLLLDVLEAMQPDDVFVISDVDIQFFRDVMPHVRQGIEGRDVCFQREFHEVGVNIGFMAIRRTEASLAFWRRVLAEVSSGTTHDQKIVNTLLHTRAADELALRWGRFPPEIWASSQAFDGGPPPAGVALHHANWIVRPAPSWTPQDNQSAADPSPKLEQLAELRRLVQAGDREGIARFGEVIAADSALPVYHSRTFGAQRTGPEWSALPDGHPGRPGGKRSKNKKRPAA